MAYQGFPEIKQAVEQQFNRMSQHPLFRTGAEKDALWITYIDSFPEGSNPVFRKRTEHDCSCCSHFIRSVGNVVAIINGKPTSIWDVEVENPAYQAVASAMSALVKAQPIVNPFFHTEGRAGIDHNQEDGEGGVITWRHFCVSIPNSRVVLGTDIGPRLDAARAAHDVLLRGLNELTLDATDTVLELVGQGSLYRGEEYRFPLTGFRKLKEQFDVLPVQDRDNFVWEKIGGDLPGAVAMIRNSAIGTLLIGISDGKDLEQAVRMFEVSIMAPANFKRSTALVSKGMVDKARATVDSLGLTSALERRYATLADISINNILFANRNARTVMTGNVFDDISTKEQPKSFERVEEVSIEKFLADILPTAQSIEVMVENRHVNNFVSLIAPVDPNAGLMFKWDNRFGWSYQGDFADSIKERVKQAGGNVTGELCCRLAWFNHDDLDFHMKEPGFEIYFHKPVSPSGGELDVDMNAGRGHTRTPVENIFYDHTRNMKDGVYKLFVHQYDKRDSLDVGFEVEIDYKGTLYQFSHDRPMKTDERVTVAEFVYSKKDGLKLTDSLKSKTVSKKVWNVDTETFRNANVIMMSPNHWDGHGVGNRHYFFMLEGCQNEGTARGFYNEFLKQELDPHRKVLEIVGGKMRAEESVDQLSGLGFSSTQRNHAIIRVKGAFTRTIRVTF